MKGFFLGLVKWISIGLFSIAVAICVACLLVSLCLEYYHVTSESREFAKMRFSPKEWKRTTTYRIDMYKDLRENYLYVGMPITELKNLLGETTLGRKYSEDSPTCFSYSMGMRQTLFFFSSYSLIICPDTTYLKVASIKLLSDDNEEDKGETIFLK